MRRAVSRNRSGIPGGRGSIGNRRGMRHRGGCREWKHRGEGIERQSRDQPEDLGDFGKCSCWEATGVCLVAGQQPMVGRGGVTRSMKTCKCQQLVCCHLQTSRSQFNDPSGISSHRQPKDHNVRCYFVSRKLVCLVFSRRERSRHGDAQGTLLRCLWTQEAAWVACAACGACAMCGACIVGAYAACGAYAM